MAILQVLKRREQSGRYDMEATSGTAERKYIVRSNSLADTENMIRTATGIPPYGALIAGIPGSCLTQKSSRRIESIIDPNGNTIYQWEVTCSFSPVKKSDTKQAQYELSPWERTYPISERSAGFDAIYCGVDLDGKPFQTTAGEPFNPCPPIQVPKIAISWKRPIQGTMDNAVSLRGYLGCINSSAFRGFAAKHVKITDYSVTEAVWQNPATGANVNYLDVSWSAIGIAQLEIRPNGYQDRVLNKGTRYYDGPMQNLEYPKDKDGQKSLSEIFLDEQGALLENVTPLTAYWIQFKTCKEVDFSTIAPL